MSNARCSRGQKSAEWFRFAAEYKRSNLYPRGCTGSNRPEEIFSKFCRHFVDSRLCQCYFCTSIKAPSERSVWPQNHISCILPKNRWFHLEITWSPLYFDICRSYNWPYSILSWIYSHGICNMSLSCWQSLAKHANVVVGRGGATDLSGTDSKANSLQLFRDCGVQTSDSTEIYRCVYADIGPKEHCINILASG